MDSPLTPRELTNLLDLWVGAEIAVRVVTNSDDLVAVFRGRLESRSQAKHPAAFWPLSNHDTSPHPEQPGLYLHPERFEHASRREGGFVLELCQDGVTLNVRRL